MALPGDALAYFDPGQGGWIAEAGEFEVRVGASSRDIRARASLTLTADALGPVRGGPPASVSLSIESTLGEILAHPAGKALLEVRFGALLGSGQVQMAMGMSLAQIAAFVPDMLTAEALEALDRALRAL
jgi:beta-glucosidase